MGGEKAMAFSVNLMQGDGEVVNWVFRTVITNNCFRRGESLMK